MRDDIGAKSEFLPLPSVTATQGIKLTKLNVNTECIINFAKTFDVANEAITEGINLEIVAESENADKQKLQELVKMAEERCPSMYSMTHEIKVKSPDKVASSNWCSHLVIKNTDSFVQIGSSPLFFSSYVHRKPQQSAHEIIIFHPKQLVLTNVTQGPITWSRVITLSPLPENKTNIDVLWNIDMSGIPFFAKGFAKDGFTKATDKAFDRLTQAAVS